MAKRSIVKGKRFAEVQLKHNYAAPFIISFVTLPVACGANRCYASVGITSTTGLHLPFYPRATNAANTLFDLRAAHSSDVLLHLCAMLLILLW